MAKKPATAQLRFSRLDFYRLRGDDFYRALCGSIERELGEGGTSEKRWATLNVHQQGLYAWWVFWGDVENGGLIQYFYNHSDDSVAALETLLQASGNEQLAEIVKQATKIYRRHRAKFKVEQLFGKGGLYDQIPDLDKLDKSVERLLAKCGKQLEKWVRENMDRIAVSENGDPIDPKLTGAIETLHANGKVFEQATIRRGVLSGTYRRFLPDGTLEHAEFYQGGAVSSDYWPNGQPKKKKSRIAKLTINEWFYPTGQLHKRYVSDEMGEAIEPIRLWHENGQLAEELHLKKGDKFGPWVKFFDDGSPQLEAEHKKGETLVVKNAWDDERRQVVKNGTGTFVDDGLNIDWEYDLYLQSDWIKAQPLRRGVLHGKVSTWHSGRLWSEANYANGKLDGEFVLYYDNGRVRTRMRYKTGKQIKAEEFPKFDNPRPAVLIEVESNSQLYKAWKLPLLDAYPRPKNLERLQARLQIPGFLQEVYERNLAGTVKDDYEDLNSFDDGVTYFVLVNERGAAEKVQFSGSSVYSISTAADYIPAIEKLKFEPGRLRGKKVASRAVVCVQHTFVEGNGK